MSKVTLIFCFLFAFWISQIVAVDFTEKIYSDSNCGEENLVVERAFTQNQCYSLSWNRDVLPTTPCQVTAECFDEAFQDDADSCPQRYGFNLTTILTGAQTFRYSLNRGGDCEAKGAQIGERSFEVCTPSLFYPNCFVKFQIGAPLDSEDSSQATGIVPSVIVIALLLVSILI